MTVDELRESVVADAKDYIDDEVDNYICEASENDDAEDIFENIYNDMYAGSVTGNDNGSYSYSRSLSRALMVDMLDTPEFIDMIKSYDIDLVVCLAGGDWESLEVYFRCYLLDQAYSGLCDYFIQNYIVQKVED